MKDKKSFVCLLVFVFIVAGALIFFGCHASAKTTVSGISGNLRLSVEPGEHWQGKMKIFIFSVNKTPQMAAWIEDAQGHYIATITVTSRSAKQNWRSAPKEGRPEALPIWNHKTQNNTAQVDSVSAATSKGALDVQIGDDLLTNGEKCNVYLEVNHSFDYNDTWPEKKNDVNGQPSLLYHAQFTAGAPGNFTLSPIGHGSVNGTDGTIVHNLEGMTTALTIIKNASILTNGASQ
jgi:hypothetical protein